MRLLRSFEGFTAEDRGGAVTIGNFDGVHRGHARIVEHLCRAAQRVSGPSVVFTFDPHPVRLLRPDAAPPPLTWIERKAELLAELGVDVVIAYPTDEALLNLTPEAFFAEIIGRQLEARAMVEGPNFAFGRDRAGSVEVLRTLCEQREVSLEVVEPIRDGDQYISSSRIRRLIADGDVDQARELLIHPYRIRGMVTHGAKRGARIGFPTANLEAVDTLLPGHGVYACRAHVSGAARDAEAAGADESLVRPAAVNIGPNPTFGEGTTKIEAHLLDFDGVLYGQPLELDFLARLRDIQPFDGVEALKDQLARDCERTRALCGA